MKEFPTPLDLKKLKVYTLARRRSLSTLEKILATPDNASASRNKSAADCAARIRAARQRNASVILMYGAHLIKNGAHKIVIDLMQCGGVTYLATNGAGSIHDWELAFLGRTEESVRENVKTGTFGTW